MPFCVSCLKNLCITKIGYLLFLLELYSFYFYMYVHDLFQVDFCIWCELWIKVLLVVVVCIWISNYSSYLLKRLPFVH